MEQDRLRRLLDAGRSLISELDPEAVLQRLLEVARDVTGARYAAIGVLDERREGLERFVTVGIDAETHRQIGDLPRGRGVLGVLITDPRPLRLADVGTHPRSYGFPLAHPPMTTFLGVPVLIEGEAWGNLYLTEKAAGEFTADDEEAVVTLAGYAGIAIANARLYRAVRERRDELERTIRGLETTTEISRALGGVTDLERVLELVAKRSRALLDARTAEIALVEGDEFVIAAVAGEGVSGIAGARMPLAGSLAAAAWRTGRTQRFAEIPADTFAARELGARTAIVTPMLFRNRPVGFLVVMDRAGGEPFREDDERLLQAFAASAATAVATAQSAGDVALRRAIEASEAERARWARELHDETLQQLAGLRVLLGGARRSRDPERIAGALDEALQMITTGIADLRALITDLRPAALDELGLAAALKTLAERVERQSGLEIDLDVDLAWERGDSPARHTIEVESAGYRLVQEALTNVVKHAGAARVQIRVGEDDDDCLEIALRDDGGGFDPDAATGGFGLVGMRERVALVHGQLDVETAPGAGTTIRARIPSRRREAPSPPRAATSRR
jgi:signal transduction histidine kinase